MPLPCQLTKKDVIFYHEHPVLRTYTNCIDKLKLSDNTLETAKLGLGKYTLILLRLDKRIDIEVIKGKKWIGNELIDEDNRIYKMRKEKGYLGLG